MGCGWGFSIRLRPPPAVSRRFHPFPAASNLKASLGSGPRAGITVHAAPCRHLGAGASVRLCAGISGQWSACKHLRARLPRASVQACLGSGPRAGTSVQTTPCRHLGAGAPVRLCASVSGHWLACRHLRASNSAQAPRCRHFRAGLCRHVWAVARVQGTSVQAARTSHSARVLMEMHLASLCRHLCAGTFAHALKHATGPKCRAASPI